MSSLRTLLALLAAITTSISSTLAAEARRGGTPEHLLDDETLLCLQYALVAVVVVDQVTSPSPHTNGNPPRLTLRVTRTIKGELQGTSLPAVWLPFPHDIDYVADWTAAAIKSWEARTAKAPEVGSTWILAGKLKVGVFQIAPRCRYPHDEKTERAVRFVLDHTPQVRAAYLTSQDVWKVARAKDEHVEKAADLSKLCAAATDIVIGDPASIEWGLGSYVVVLYSCERLLDSRPPEDRPNRPCVRADARFEARAMALFRVRRTVDGVPVIVFLKPSDQDTLDIPPQAREGTDPRPFEFADPVNGILRATPDRVEAVKAILARRAK